MIVDDTRAKFFYVSCLDMHVFNEMELYRYVSLFIQFLVGKQENDDDVSNVYIMFTMHATFVN